MYKYKLERRPDNHQHLLQSIYNSFGYNLSCCRWIQRYKCQSALQ